MFLFTGCGTATVIGSSSIVQPTSLHVVRPATINNVPTFERTVNNATAVQNLFKAAYALPAAPTKGVINCPADLAIVYHLTFMKGTRVIQQMTLNATGCQFLQIGSGTSDLRYAGYNFQQLTAKTIGLASLVPEIR